MMNISCLLLAAGSSTRMGEINKLLLKTDGVSFIKKNLKEIEKLVFSEVVVVTGFESDRVKEEVEDSHVQIAYNAIYKNGMHSSIKAGLKALRHPCDGFMICLADQPFFSHEILQLLINTFESVKGPTILVPAFEGKRGHPVLISSHYLSEILNEADGDYGCSYLLKRHASEVLEVPVKNEGILVDVDTPEDYQRLIERSYNSCDPVEMFFKKVMELRTSKEPFAIATVVEVEGSASARIGSKAIFNQEGKNLLGWVGGGCAERFIAEESQQALEEGKGRVVLADLDDEIFGLGVACGGRMKVYIDPFLPCELITLSVPPALEEIMTRLAGYYGWSLKKIFNNKEPETIEELIIHLSEVIAKKRGRSGQSLRLAKKVPAYFMDKSHSWNGQVTLVGGSRIIEALERHFNLLSSQVRTIPFEKFDDHFQFHKEEVVIIASHHARDKYMIERALKETSVYVAMVGSFKRSVEILTHLNLMEQKIRSPLFIPAGLDIEAKNPDEIALSIVAEVLKVTRRQHGP